ncbi:hypothetical protein CDEST_09134 [Colletotrichum destructivum]|uniref:Uncharacterized protein n=1 Tax=Colletotrichum destructivum TaxID=34406 RepID=A0AAX4IM94_9PEZI|nr:hypothetical protein CDEST_09134 [Colletotrichum destructivum]
MVRFSTKSMAEERVLKGNLGRCHGSDMTLTGITFTGMFAQDLNTSIPYQQGAHVSDQANGMRKEYRAATCWSWIHH